ncbi:MAG TPA: tetratricopeptide repeat protein [Terriglobia bacterium]|nr:tetratricopeptide repeat protein [Terriglobia bacterium]
MMRPSEKQLLPLCAMLLLAGGCVTRTAGRLPPQAASAERSIKPASLSEYIRGVYKLSSEASVKPQQRATLLAEAPELAELVDRAEQDPTDAEARSRVVAAYMSRNLYWGAYEILTDGLPIDGTQDPDINLNLAIIWDAWGFYDLAHQYADRAINHGAESAIAFETMGRIQLHRRDTAQALAWYNRALEGERTARILANMGYAHMLKGEWDSARSALEEATTLDDTLEHAHNNLAVVLSKTGDDTGALAHLLRAGTPAVAFNNMGVLCMTNNRLPDARHYFEAALRLEPNYDLARRNLNAVLEQLPSPSIIRLPSSEAAPVDIRLDESGEPQTGSLETANGGGHLTAPTAEETQAPDPATAINPAMNEPIRSVPTADLSGPAAAAVPPVRHERIEMLASAKRDWGAAGFAGLAFVTGLFALRSRKTSIPARQEIR